MFCKGTISCLEEDVSEDFGRGQVLENLVCHAKGLGQCPRGGQTVKLSKQINGLVRFVI